MGQKRSKEEKEGMKKKRGVHAKVSAFILSFEFENEGEKSSIVTVKGKKQGRQKKNAGTFAKQSFSPLYRFKDKPNKKS